MTKEERLIKLNKFFSDPDWVLIEEMLKEYIDPLRSVTDIDVENRTADSVMAEVAGKKKTIEQLEKFLRDSRILKGREVISKISFK